MGSYHRPHDLVELLPPRDHPSQASVLAQLRDYGFISLPVSELTMSEGTYLPTYEGFDLGFDLSASDMVRTIWSHRHAQLLVFDEPRQQSTGPMSFTALFERAGQAVGHGQQVIFAASEPEVSVRGVDHQYLDFDGRMIRRLEQ